MKSNILIIDFESDVRRNLESVLRKEGYNVRGASSREEVIDFFKSESFDLAIMDIRIPGTNGLELIKEVKELGDDIDVIVLTGSASIENAVKALRDYRVFDFLCKPLESLDQLTGTVKRALQKNSLPKDKAVSRKLKQGL